jgi:hypothetical protein
MNHGEKVCKKSKRKRGKKMKPAKPENPLESIRFWLFFIVLPEAKTQIQIGKRLPALFSRH